MLSLGVVALLAGPIGTATAAPARQATSKPSDKTIDDRIENRIKADASLKKYDIDVSVDQGIATLTGTVATSAQRDRAARDAKVSGVTRVDNRIVVDANAAKGTTGALKEKANDAADKTKEATSKAVDKTKDASEKAVDKTKEGLSKTGEVITDAWITGRVHSGFIGEDLLKDSDVDVDTSNHVVTLKGRVTSAAGGQRAVAIAKNVEGVHEVVDRLTVGPKPKD
jgi:hyperosmotically inducible protein